MRFLTKYFLISFFLILFFTSNGWGVTYTWTGTFSTDWNNANNWSPSDIPSGLDDVVFDGSISNVNCEIVNLLNSIANAKNITIKSTYTGTISIQTGESVINAESIIFEAGTTATFEMNSFGTCTISCYKFDMQGGTFKGSSSPSSGLVIKNDNIAITSLFSITNNANFQINNAFVVFGSGVASQNVDISYTNSTSSANNFFKGVTLKTNDKILLVNNDIVVTGNLTLESGIMNIISGTPKMRIGNLDAENFSDVNIQTGYTGGTLPIHFVGDNSTRISGQTPVSVSNPIVINKNVPTGIGKLILLNNIDLIVNDFTLTQGKFDIKSPNNYLSVENTLNYTIGNQAYISGGRLRRKVTNTGGTFIYPMGQIDNGNNLYFPMELAMNAPSGDTHIEVRTFIGHPELNVSLPLTRASKKMYWNVQNQGTNIVNTTDIKLYAPNASDKVFQGITSIPDIDLRAGYYELNTSTNINRFGTGASTGNNFVQPNFVSPFIFPANTNNHIFLFATENPIVSTNPLGNPLPVGEDCNNLAEATGLQNIAPIYNSLNDQTFAITNLFGNNTPPAGVLPCGEPLQDRWLDLGNLSAGTYSIEYTNNTKIVGLAVYTACSTYVASSCTDASVIGTKRVQITTTGGIQYILRVMNYTDADGISGVVTTRKNPDATEIYDLSCDALPITVNNTPTPFNILSSFQNHELRGSPSCVSLANKNDGWVKFTANSISTTITYTNTTQDAAIVVYSGTSCNSLVEIANTCTNEIVGIGTENITFATTVGITYYVRIINAISGANMNGTIEIKDTPPLPPTNLTFSNITNTSVSVGYTASISVGIVGYTLEYSFSNSPFSPIGAGTLSNQTTNPISVGTSLPQLLANTTYFVRMRANNGTIFSVNSVVGSFTTKISAVPLLAPTLQTSNSFQANWSLVGGANYYVLDVSTGASFSSMLLGYNGKNVGLVNSAIVDNVAPNTIYYYRVRAVVNGVESVNPNSPNGQVVSTLLPSPNISVPANSITSSGFVVNWGVINGATNYDVEYSIDGGSTFIVQQNITNAPYTYTFNTLSENTTYLVRVQAKNGTASATSISNVVSVTTSDIVPVPLLVWTNGASTSFALNWNDIPNIDEYRLDISTDNTFTIGFLPTFNNRYIAPGITTINVVGVSPNITYYFRMRAKAGNIFSVYATGDIMLLSAPVANVVALNTITTSGFTGSWNSISNATSYYVDITKDNTFSIIDFEEDAFTTSYQASGLTAGTIYYYRVRAVNNNGTSSNSNVISFITTPNAPTSINETSTSFTANWTATAGATSYTLQVSADAGFNPPFIYDQNVTSTSQTISGLTTGTTYFFRIKANANTPNAISSNFSANAQVTPTSQVLAPPIAIAATDVANISFTANWQQVVGATEYELDIALDNGFINIINSFPNITATSRIITGLTANNTYYYQVRAKNAGGASVNSNIISVTTLNAGGNIPETPTNVSPFATSSTTIEVSWQDESTNETGFELQRKTGLTGNYTTIYIAPANASGSPLVSYVDDNLTPNTKYFYQVRALGAVGNSAYSEENSTTTLPEAITKPTFLEASTASINSIELNWTDNANNEDGYKIYRAKQGDNNFVLVTTTPLSANITTYTNVITPSNVGEVYFYYVVAIKGNTESQPTNVSGAILADVPIKPSNFVASVTGTTTTSLTWNDNSNNEISFVIEMKSLASNGFFVFLKEVPANSTSTIITGLLPNQQYTFKIYAENNAGESPSIISNQINTNLDPNIQVPNAPSEPQAEAISTIEIGIRWKYNKAGDAVMFRIERSNIPTGTFVEVGRILANRLNFSDTKNIIAGTTYYYRVVATNGGGNSQFSPIVSVIAECNVTTVINTDQAGSGNIACDTKQVLLQLSTNVTVGRLQWFKNGLAINGATFSSYTATETGEYYCRILAGDCDKKTEVKSILIVPSFIVQVSFVNDRLTSNRLGAGTYQWYYEYQPIAGAIQDNHIPTRAGVYYLMVTQGACSVVSNLFTFVPTALEVSFSQALQIYPNPAQNEISLKIEHPQMGDFEVFAIDMQGKKIELAKGYKDENIYTQKINVSQLNQSVYILEINMKGLKGQKKLIKL